MIILNLMQLSQFHMYLALKEIGKMQIVAVKPTD